MAKSEKLKPKPKPKPKKKPDKDQAERFKQAARQIGADETGGAFEKAFSRIIKPKLPENS